MTTAPTQPPPPPQQQGPGPYQQKLERQRANRQAKRQARYERRNAVAPSGGMNREFSESLYGNTSISNDEKNSIQDVHERYSQGQATHQQMGQAIFNSGLPHELKLRLMQMQEGAPAAGNAERAPKQSPPGGMSRDFGQALYSDTSISNDEKNAIQGIHERFANGQATRQELAQAVFNSGLPHELKIKLMQMYGGGVAQPSGPDPVVGSGAPADPKIINEAIRSPGRRFIATI